MTLSAKNKLRRRLKSYWKLELLNVIFVPAIMVFLSVSLNYRLGPVSFATMIPMCGLLYVGGIYWRAKWRALDDGQSAVWDVMPVINMAKWPLALLSAGAVALAVAAWLRPGLTASRGDQWTATTAAALAGLEYINYYHRQLQHFDHAPDFKKLITGQGFRRSQLARDLSVWKRARS